MIKTFKTHNGRIEIHTPEDEWDSPLIYIHHYDSEEDRIIFSLTNDDAKHLFVALIDVTHE